MDYSVKKESYNISETVFDAVVEQPVDLDFSLPDYCPDIKKILKCQISPQISSRNISGDRLYIEGSADISLIYVDDEKMSIRCCEHTLPFSLSINLKSAVHDAIVFTKTKIEYVNCRAVTPRRLDIHGAFSVFVKVKCKQEKNIVHDIDGEGIEKKKLLTKYNNVLGIGQQYFTIEETIGRDNNQTNIEYILKTAVSTDLEDYKTLSNKVIVNAQMNIKVLYVSDIEYGTVDTLDYTIPISQIVDIEGVQDDCACDVNIDVLNYDISIKQGEKDENTLLFFESKICISAVAFDEKDTSVLSDVYSIDYESEPKYETFSLSHLCDKINEQFTCKDNIDIGDNGISEIIDITGEITNSKTFVKEGKLYFAGKINVCIFAEDSEEKPFYAERLIEFEHKYDLDKSLSSVICDEKILLKSCSGKISGHNSVEVNIELKITALVFAENNYTSVTDIYIDDEKPKLKDKKAALTIYYADDGEELWNIARKYCTSVDKIKTENELDDDVLQGRNMIFIPM